MRIFTEHEAEWHAALEEQEWQMAEEILVGDMIENVVHKGTHQSYYDDSFHFIKWCHASKPTWITDYGNKKLEALEASAAGGNGWLQERHVKEGFMELFQNAE